MFATSFVSVGERDRWSLALEVDSMLILVTAVLCSFCLACCCCCSPQVGPRSPAIRLNSKAMAFEEGDGDLQVRTS